MKKLVFTLFTYLLLTSCTPSSDKVTVTWNIKLNHPVDNEVYIVGNQDFLGYWNPNQVKMEKVNELHWTFSHEVAPEKLLEFKFTQGDWKYQAADKNGTERHNDEFLVPQKDTTFHLLIEKWTDGKDNKTTGQITGEVKYHQNFHIDGLLDRDIIVWLPPSYHAATNKRYPVLYMHDGQNIIDPKTSSFGVDWQVDETCDSLIKKGMLEEIIIVGSYCTADRTEDYGDTEKGKIYRKSIAANLKNFIDKNYRTKPEKQNTAVAGSSMGGLVSFMIAWEYPETFKGAICMSPAFKYEDFDYIESIKSDPKKELLLYIDNGGKQVDVVLQEGVDKMSSSLKTKGYKEGEDLFVVIDKQARHSEGDWAKRFPSAIQLFFKK
ncbi:alpha/beta hydrolase-fold protein [Flammeovirga aprica]|uniref:Histidine kinase n=1 Tax=Flammeovirga aprica JL-4 TaxID=694437 RepID=A0A7X9RWB1_9BACT|nr:alpha/beta hydrolase-fold protein [Flammeovirga aprica]NME69921.1 histidine kinase [Flammeovirga aprica JL-4]